MSEIEWDRLVRFGLTDLGLSPDVFWSMTPVELMLMAGSHQTDGVMSRSGLTDLMKRFPDKTEPPNG